VGPDDALDRDDIILTETEDGGFEAELSDEITDRQSELSEALDSDVSTGRLVSGDVSGKVLDTDDGAPGSVDVQDTTGQEQDGFQIPKVNPRDPLGNVGFVQGIRSGVSSSDPGQFLSNLQSGRELVDPEFGFSEEEA
jgi:hypothetical protein